MRPFAFLVIFTFLSSSIFAIGATQIKVFNDKKQSTISYSMNHALHAWTGVSKDVTSIILTDESKDKIDKVAVSVKVSTFDSQNANRDSHVMESTEAIKFPNITFTSTSVVLVGKKLTVTGNLNFHGVNKTITFDAEESRSNNQLTITGGFTVKMTDFKIEPPSLMGIATDDEFKINFVMVF